MTDLPRNSASRYVVNATSSVVTTLIRMSALVWVNQYLLRRISPEEYAIFPVITALMVIAELFPTVFLRGLARFMVEADVRRDDAQMAAIVSSMLLVLFAVAALLFCGGIIVAIHIDSVITVAPEYRTDAQAMLLMLIAVLCLRVATTPFRVGLHVRMRFVEQNLVLLATELVRVGLLLTLLLAVSTQVLWVAVASSIANALNVAIMIVYTISILPAARFRHSAISTETVKTLLSFSLWTLFQGLNNLIIKAFPALLLNRTSNAIDVAAFHVGSLADMQIRRLVISAAAPAKPALTTVYAREGEDALQAFYYRGGRYYLWVTLFLLPPLIMFAYPLITLYVGERYVMAATVMIILLSAYPFTWASGMFYEVAYSVGRIKTFNICLMILSAVAVAAMSYLVIGREMGAIGAALGLGGAQVAVYFLIMWPAGLRLVDGSWSVFLRQTLLPGLAPFGAAMLGCLLYAQAYPITSWLGFFTGAGVSVLIYVGMLVSTCLDPVDRDLLARGRHKIKSRLFGLRNST
ncbi:MAG: oligosaccharide flippase family protein [Pseudomonadota bacterium]